MDLYIALAATVILVAIWCWRMVRTRALKRQRLVDACESQEKLYRELQKSIQEAQTTSAMSSVHFRVHLLHGAGELDDNQFYHLLEEYGARAAVLRSEGERAAAAALERLEVKALVLMKELAPFDPDTQFQALFTALMQNDEAFYNELLGHSESQAVSQLLDMFEELLAERLRKLIVAVRHESAQAREELDTLCSSLECGAWGNWDATALEELLIPLGLADEWNEMIVSLKSRPEWSDIIGLSELENEDLEKVFQGAESGDLLSLQKARLLYEDDDEDFEELVIERFGERLAKALERCLEQHGTLAAASHEVSAAS